ncbi:MAG: hypothetical protein DHS20C18_16720 [Saprospiraceae bacterium]|nr:MAG: hypothetical protein DHS20C18_16720 [Saprospiraceae bacterium]
MSHSKQITDTIMMVRPANFGYNVETAENNAFQVNDTSIPPEKISELAKDEFDQFVEKLNANGIEVIIIEDSADPVKMDAIFPNNWISFHDNGQIITYPMFSPIRRQERRPEVVEMMVDQFHFSDIINLEKKYESSDRFLEGTGSMILDRENQLVYACLSVRTHPDLVRDFCHQINYEPILFHSVDQQAQEIYHTNVMMSVGDNFAVICLEAIPDREERAFVVEKLEQTGKEIIEISMHQMASFAGNMLQVRNKTGKTFLVMSEQAYHSLTPEQVKIIEQKTNILYSPLKVIETYGGGSARCMMAEVFRPE